MRTHHLSELGRSPLLTADELAAAVRSDFDRLYRMKYNSKRVRILSNTLLMTQIKGENNSEERRKDWIQRMLYVPDALLLSKVSVEDKLLQLTR
jgi:hypothetical protein